MIKYLERRRNIRNVREQNVRVAAEERALKLIIRGPSSKAAGTLLYLLGLLLLFLFYFFFSFLFPKSTWVSETVTATFPKIGR